MQKAKTQLVDFSRRDQQELNRVYASRSNLTARKAVDFEKIAVQ